MSHCLVSRALSPGPAYLSLRNWKYIEKCVWVINTLNKLTRTNQTCRKGKQNRKVQGVGGKHKGERGRVCVKEKPTKCKEEKCQNK